MVTFSFECVWFFFKSGSWFTASTTATLRRSKREGDLKVMGMQRRGCQRGRWQRWHILLAPSSSRCRRPRRQLAKEEAGPFRCEWTAGGTQLWLHAVWEVYMVCKLYMLLVIPLRLLNRGFKSATLGGYTWSHSLSGPDGSHGNKTGGRGGKAH